MSIRVSSNQMVYGYQKQLNDANTRQTTLLEQAPGRPPCLSRGTAANCTAHLIILWIMPNISATIHRSMKMSSIPIMSIMVWRG